MTSDHGTPPAVSAEDAALAAPPDESNPALKDLTTTFIATLALFALFMGTVIVFIL